MMTHPDNPDLWLDNGRHAAVDGDTVAVASEPQRQPMKLVQTPELERNGSSPSASPRTAVYPADGQTITLDIWRPRNRVFLFDSKFGRDILEIACRAAGAKILDQVFIDFGVGAGYTGMLVLAQSHCSIHTYPEKEFVAIDVYTCGPLDTQRVVTEVVKMVKPSEYHVHILPRLATPPSQQQPVDAPDSQ